MNEKEFWQAVYVASIQQQGQCGAALMQANKAVKHLQRADEDAMFHVEQSYAEEDSYESN